MSYKAPALGSRSARTLAAIGLQLLEDFVALAVEDAHADRASRPDCIRRRADRVGRVRRANVGFSDNGRPVIAGDAEELKAELPRSDRENAFQFFQLPNLWEEPRASAQARLRGLS